MIRFFLISILLPGCAFTPLDSSNSSTTPFIGTSNIKEIREFEERLNTVDNVEINSYLTNFTNNILKKNPILKNKQAKTKLIYDLDLIYRNYSFLGVNNIINVYISIGFLKNIKYENTLASAISIEISNLINNHVFNNFTKTKDIKKVFEFSEDQLKRSLDKASKFIFNTKYDLRGLIGYWEFYEDFIRHSPYSISVINISKTVSNELVFSYVPRPNSTVKSLEFMSFLKKVKKL